MRARRNLLKTPGVLGVAKPKQKPRETVSGEAKYTSTTGPREAEDSRTARATDRRHRASGARQAGDALERDHLRGCGAMPRDLLWRHRRDHEVGRRGRAGSRHQRAPEHLE